MPRALLRNSCLALAAALTGCGTIQTPATPIGSIDVPVPPLISPGVSTYYLNSNTFRAATLPALLSGVTLTGTATYTGDTGTRTFTVLLARTKPDCPEAGALLVCTRSTGGGDVIGTLTVTPGTPATLTLQGDALDRAAHAGYGQLGLTFQQGPRSGSADHLTLRDLHATARL